MRKIIGLFLVLGLTMALNGCATTYDPTQKAPGFLPDYSLLKPVPSPQGTHIYMYKDPNANRSDYNAAIVESVALYQTATESGVTQEQIEAARAGIESGIKQIVSKQLKVTTKPGYGVVNIKVAITGAMLEGDGFKPRYVIPISAAIKLASMATGLDNKTPVLVVEIKVTDSKSGALLKEVVSTISGDKFRMVGSTPGEFQKLATSWVDAALKYTSGDQDSAK